MENFQSLGLHESLLQALIKMKYEVPTSIQSQTIPVALEGKDILGTAQTGTGKTAAFGIPLISYLLASDSNVALVLTPTRELAMQVLALLEQMIGKKGNIKTALIIGGDPIMKQLNQLSNNARLIVGTPGRVNDHLTRGSLKLNNCKFLVLDETDRMLDMGFGIQLEQIAKFLPLKRQTLMFSATLPKNIQTLASKYLKDPIRISVGSTIAAADTIKQEIVHTTESEKYNVLLEQLSSREGSCIIFVKTKISTEKLSNKLREYGHSADAIHGDLRQRNREKVIRGFRNKKSRILVATDIAARGLDIPHLEHVLNYDLPQCEEDFIHRIGRTGRAGVEGSAISFITPQDRLKWGSICKMMNPDMKLDSRFDDNKDSKGPRKGKRPERGNRFGLNSSGSKNSPRRSIRTGEANKKNSETEDNFWNDKPKRRSDEGKRDNVRGDRFSASTEGRGNPRGDRFGGSTEGRGNPRGDRFSGSSEGRGNPRGDRFSGSSEGRGNPRGDRFGGSSDGRGNARGDRFGGSSEGRGNARGDRFGSSSEGRGNARGDRFGSSSEGRGNARGDRFGGSKEGRSNARGDRFGGSSEKRSNARGDRFDGSSERPGNARGDRFGGSKEGRSNARGDRFGSSEGRGNARSNRFGNTANKKGGNGGFASPSKSRRVNIA